MEEAISCLECQIVLSFTEYINMLPEIAEFVCWITKNGFQRRIALGSSEAETYLDTNKLSTCDRNFELDFYFNNDLVSGTAY